MAGAWPHGRVEQLAAEPLPVLYPPKGAAPPEVPVEAFQDVIVPRLLGGSADRATCWRPFRGTGPNPPPQDPGEGEKVDCPEEEALRGLPCGGRAKGSGRRGGDRSRNQQEEQDEECNSEPPSPAPFDPTAH